MVRGVWLAWFLLTLLSGMTPSSRAEEITESQVKAVWILNFAKYVEWPAV
jgi:hypothetical protein